MLVNVTGKDRNVAKSSFTQSILVEQIKACIAKNFGDFNYGRIVCSGSLVIKYFNPLTGVFLVRCFRDDIHRVGFALSTILVLDDEQCKGRNSARWRNNKKLLEDAIEVSYEKASEVEKEKD